MQETLDQERHQQVADSRDHRERGSQRIQNERGGTTRRSLPAVGFGTARSAIPTPYSAFRGGPIAGNTSRRVQDFNGWRAPLSAPTLPWIMPTLQNMVESSARHRHLAAGSRGVIGLIETLALCEQSCLLCADASICSPQSEALRTCIQRNLDCADVCRATANVLLRRTEGADNLWELQLQACVAALRSSIEASAEHARSHQHCTVSADICHAGVEACLDALAGRTARPNPDSPSSPQPRDPPPSP
jgi:hypothetical protein